MSSLCAWLSGTCSIQHILADFAESWPATSSLVAQSTNPYSQEQQYSSHCTGNTVDHHPQSDTLMGINNTSHHAAYEYHGHRHGTTIKLPAPQAPKVVKSVALWKLAQRGWQSKYVMPLCVASTPHGRSSSIPTHSLPEASQATGPR